VHLWLKKEKEMRQEILEHIKELEATKDIKILLAAESGSRAWGFPSPDSDYDVRIIYMHRLNWYLSITDKKDNMDYFIGKELDINGWDIRKVLRLLRKSNASTFEWNQSPIIYQSVGGFQEELMSFSKQFFQAKHALNHYKGIARNSYESLVDKENIKLKKLFYVLRPLLAAMWVVEKETVPPMDIFNLFEVVKEEKIITTIKELIALKETVNEDYMHRLDNDLDGFILAGFAKIEQTEHLADSVILDATPLDNYFRNLLELR